MGALSEYLSLIRRPTSRGRLFVKFFAKSSPLIERERERVRERESLEEGADKQLEEGRKEEQPIVEEFGVLFSPPKSKLNLINGHEGRRLATTFLLVTDLRALGDMNDMIRLEGEHDMQPIHLICER